MKESMMENQTDRMAMTAIGDRVFVYGSTGGFGVIEKGPYLPVIEALFGHPADDAKRMVVDVRLDGGEVIRRSTSLACDLDAVLSSWHVVDDDGGIIAGGPGIDRERAVDIAIEIGGVVVRGLP